MSIKFDSAIFFIVFPFISIRNECLSIVDYIWSSRFCYCCVAIHLKKERNWKSFFIRTCRHT